MGRLVDRWGKRSRMGEADREIWKEHRRGPLSRLRELGVRSHADLLALACDDAVSFADREIALDVLSWVGDRWSAVPALARMLSSCEPWREAGDPRGGAAEALTMLDGRAAVEALTRVAERHPVGGVRTAAIGSLGTARAARMVAARVLAMAADSGRAPTERAVAVDALGSIFEWGPAPPEVVAFLEEMLEARAPVLRHAAAHALGFVDSQSSLAALQRVTGDRARVRRETVGAAARRSIRWITPREA